MEVEDENTDIIPSKTDLHNFNGNARSKILDLSEAFKNERSIRIIPVETNTVDILPTDIENFAVTVWDYY